MFKLEMRHIHVPKSFSFCKGQKEKKVRRMLKGSVSVEDTRNGYHFCQK